MRLVTRSDFDGLACAVLLKEVGLISSWKFVHPKDLQDGNVEITSNDILANVPYVEGCGLWFDHHLSESYRVDKLEFEGMFKLAPSVARVVWEYYGGDDTFRPSMHSFLDAVDKVDAANLTREEIMSPEGWILLGLIMDPRTGLGRFKHFRISNYRLMEYLIGFCQVFSVDEILSMPDVKERVDIYYEQTGLYNMMLDRCTIIHKELAIIDFRNEDTIYAGNRFIVYSKYPEVNISLQIMWGIQKRNIVVSVGKSVLNRTSRVNVGRLMLKYGGGGHEAVGTCQLDVDGAEEKIQEIVYQILQDN